MRTFEARRESLKAFIVESIHSAMTPYVEAANTNDVRSEITKVVASYLETLGHPETVHIDVHCKIVEGTDVIQCSVVCL